VIATLGTAAAGLTAVVVVAVLWESHRREATRGGIGASIEHIVNLAGGPISVDRFTDIEPVELDVILDRLVADNRITSRGHGPDRIVGPVPGQRRTGP
jgi:hypothetical protein